MTFMTPSTIIIKNPLNDDNNNKKFIADKCPCTCKKNIYNLYRIKKNMIKSAQVSHTEIKQILKTM